MAAIVLTNAFVRGFDTAAVATWSSYIRSVTVNFNAEMHDKTTFRSSGRKKMGGLKDASITMEFNQDFADNKIDEQMYDLLGSSSGWIRVNPTTEVTSASNPKYSGHIVLSSYSPLSGNIGDFQAPSVTVESNGLFTRSTTAT